jgi:hypothetical protein
MLWRRQKYFLGPPAHSLIDVIRKGETLRRMCGPKRDEAAGGWRKLHNEELHSL